MLLITILIKLHFLNNSALLVDFVLLFTLPNNRFVFFCKVARHIIYKGQYCFPVNINIAKSILTTNSSHAEGKIEG